MTAVSANHYSEAMELVGNVNHQVRAVNKDIKFFIYDLGLTASQSIKVSFLQGHVTLYSCCPCMGVTWQIVPLRKLAHAINRDFFSFKN